MLIHKTKKTNIQHVIKLQAPFEKVKASCHENGELALFKAIITQSIIDATCTDTSKGGAGEKARQWIFWENHSFKFACECAGLEPENIRKLAKEAIEKNWAKNAKKKPPSLETKVF